MKYAKMLLMLVLIMVVPAWAQEASTAKPPEKQAEPATKVEKFIARRGQLIIKDFYYVGVATGLYSDSLEVKCLVLSSPASAQPEKVFGVRFERPAVERYESAELSFLDYDETADLAEALDYMIKLAANMASQDIEYREVIYETRGGMQLGFYQKKAEQVAFARVGGSIGGKSVFLTIGSLGEIREHIGRAMDKLKGLGAK